MNITIEIKGGKEIQSKLKRLGNELNKLPISMMQIGRYLTDYYSSQVFISHGSVLGQRWQDVTAATAKYKAKHYPGTGTQTLVRTGTMRRSFIFDASTSSVRIGNSVDYFQDHQLGLGGLPIRRMTGFNLTIKKQIAQIIKAEVQAKIDTA